MSVRRLVLAGCLVLAVLGAVPAAASAFGTVRILGQRAEHERITRLALGCRDGQTHDGSCFERASLNQVAGSDATWGAVGAPDNIPLHLGGGPPYWHCDDADFLGAVGYPQSRVDATQRLNECRFWAREMLYDGVKHFVEGRSWPQDGALDRAKNLLNNGRVDVSDPGTGVFNPPCLFDGKAGRAKCNVYEPFGYVLHAVEDFYSHSNWADQPDPTKPISITNPPGLGHRDLPSFWDLRAEAGTLPDTNLATGCYPTDRCHGRITHDEGLSKDRADINTESGLVTDPTMPRGKIGDNTQRAVNDAINEARRQWAILRFLLVERYGAENGGKMICALTSDSADRSCNDGHKARTEFAPDPSSRVQLASNADPTKCLDDPERSRNDGTKLQLFQCNGTEAQVFEFTGSEIQFKSTGTTPALRVMGKCVDSPQAATADGTRIQIFGCNGTPAQSVTLDAHGELQLLGKCLTLENGQTANQTGIVLLPCVGDRAQVWQLR